MACGVTGIDTRNIFILNSLYVVELYFRLVVLLLWPLIADSVCVVLCCWILLFLRAVFRTLYGHLRHVVSTV